MREPSAEPVDSAPCPATCGEDVGAWLERLRARGAAQCDVAGWQFIEGLARRAAHAPPRRRAAIVRRLARALEDLEARLDRLAGASARPGDRLRPQSGDSPLAQLLAGLGEPAATSTGGTADLKALRYFRRSWRRLHTERQLAQALTQAPENAGPLNSQHLLLQAMTRLKALSPDYLEAFIGYADALLWLEPAGAMLDATKKEPARAAVKSPPSKSASRRPAKAAGTRRTRTRPRAES